MFHRFSAVVVILASYIFTASYSETLAANPAAQLEIIKIDQEPAPTEWRAFLQASEDFRAQLWDYNLKRGKKLGDWYWVWRMAWIRACSRSAANYCHKILRAALFDDAMVVRADAAVKLGRRYAGTGNKRITRLLHKAAGNPENYRGGKPLFIQKRLVFALHEIGGTIAQRACQDIAAKDDSLKSYYQRLARF